MNGYDIQFDSANNSITIKYVDLVDYQTLLKSLDELQHISMLDRIYLILDFNEMQNFRVGYQQLLNVRQGLKSFLSKNKVSRIVIINPRVGTLLESLCSAPLNVENDFKICPFPCFMVEKKIEAYQLLQ